MGFHGVCLSCHHQRDTFQWLTKTDQYIIPIPYWLMIPPGLMILMIPNPNEYGGFPSHKGYSPVLIPFGHWGFSITKINQPGNQTNQRYIGVPPWLYGNPHDSNPWIDDSHRFASLPAPAWSWMISGDSPALVHKKVLEEFDSNVCMYYIYTYIINIYLYIYVYTCKNTSITSCNNNIIHNHLLTRTQCIYEFQELHVNT